MFKDRLLGTAAPQYWLYDHPESLTNLGCRPALEAAHDGWQPV